LLILVPEEGHLTGGWLLLLMVGGGWFVMNPDRVNQHPNDSINQHQ
jgi:hypothetical protein